MLLIKDNLSALVSPFGTTTNLKAPESRGFFFRISLLVWFGKLEFWKNRTCFSMDAFYSDEQSEELLDLFKTIKMKAKEFSNENAKKKNLKGLKFRRMKFYDMTFMFLFALLLGMTTISNNSYAGGNDPTGHAKAMIRSDYPVMRNGGGGRDPDRKYLGCILNIEGHKVIVGSNRLCKIQFLLEMVQVCEDQTKEDSADCEELFYSA